MARLCQAGLFDVVEMGLVDQVLLEERVRLTGQLDQKTLMTVGSKLKIDAVIMGYIEEYNLVRVENYEIPVVAISLRLVDSRTGSIIWIMSNSHTGSDKEKAFGMGRIISLSRLSAMVMNDVVDSLSQALLQVPVRRVTAQSSEDIFPKITIVSVEEKDPLTEQEPATATVDVIKKAPPKASVEDIKEETRKKAKEYFEKIKVE